MLASGHEVGSDTGKWNWQFIEALELRVGQGYPVQNQIDLLARVKPGGELQSLAQTKFKHAGIFASILFAAKREILKTTLSANDFIPLDALHYLVEFCGISTGGVNAANQSTHACSRDVAYRDVVFLQILDDTDMRQPQGSPSFQHQPHFG